MSTGAKQTEQQV